MDPKLHTDTSHNRESISILQTNRNPDEGNEGVRLREEKTWPTTAEKCGDRNSFVRDSSDLEDKPTIQQGKKRERK